MVAAIGTLCQCGIDSSNPVTKRFDFMRSSLGVTEDFIDTNGLRGTYRRDKSRLRQGNRRIQGTITMQPNSVEWSYLLPWITDGTPSGSGTVTYPLADTAPTLRYVAIDHNATSLFTYDNVAVDVARLTAQQGEPLQLDLDVVGFDETISGSFPALSIDTANGPFILTDAVVSINSTAVSVPEISLTLSKGINKDRFLNSQTLTAQTKLDRHVTFSVMPPFGDFYALYNLGVGTTAVTLTFTYGSAVLTISLPYVAFPRLPIDVPGRQEVMLPLTGMCMASGSTNEMTVQLAVGP